MTKRLYIETVGCQMNVLDSELVAAGLLEAGYELVDHPRQADTILLNTCSVRQHAEDKVYSALGRLKAVEGRRPGRRSSACWAAWRRRTRRRSSAAPPHVDLVVGPGQLARCRPCWSRWPADRRPRLEVGLDRTGPRPWARAAELRPLRSAAAAAQLRAVPHQAMVRIMFGCDKCCTYCIVPRVRGPEQSRPAAEIVDEVRRLVDRGLPGGDAAGPDGQQLPGPQRRPDRAAGRSAWSGSTASRACGG